MRHLLMACISSVLMVCKLPDQLKNNVNNWFHFNGFNVAILVGLAGTASRRLLGPRRGLVLTLAVIALYTLLVGAAAPEVLARLQGRTVLRTDMNGDIRLETDGVQLWVTTER